MAIIKNLIFCSKDRLKNLTSFVNFECSATGFVPFPLDILHYMLPFKMKFLKESYVAIDNGKTYGLITLEKDDNNKNKLENFPAFFRGKFYRIWRTFDKLCCK